MNEKVDTGKIIAVNKFKIKSISNGSPICYKQSWNKQCQESSMSIDRLSDIIGKIFG